MKSLLFDPEIKAIPANSHEASVIQVAVRKYSPKDPVDDLGKLAERIESSYGFTEETREQIVSLRHVHSRMLEKVEMHRYFADSTLYLVKHDFPATAIAPHTTRFQHFVRGRVERENTLRAQMSIPTLDPFVIVAFCERQSAH